jgi:hypothetical protein
MGRLQNAVAHPDDFIQNLVTENTTEILNCIIYQLHNSRKNVSFKEGVRTFFDPTAFCECSLQPMG